jgi:hypothetical protein
MARRVKESISKRTGGRPVRLLSLSEEHQSGRIALGDRPREFTPDDIGSIIACLDGIVDPKTFPKVGGRTKREAIRRGRSAAR